MLIFTELNLEDIAVLLNKSKNAFIPKKGAKDAEIKKLLEDNKNDSRFKVYGFTENKIPVSYIVALPHADETTISIGPMYVSQKYRVMGLGKAQVANFIDRAKANGFKAIFTITWSGNQGSRKIFDDLGFKITKTQEDDRANGDATLHLLYLTY